MLLTGLGVAAALAFARSARPRPYAVAKTVASLGFLWTALAAGALGAEWSRWAFVALLLSASGDVALTVRTARGFLLGLLCFAFAHGTYALAFARRGVALGTLALTAALAALAAWGAWRAFGGRVPRRMRVPVALYLAVLAAMLAAGGATAILHRSWRLGIGALLVAGSDVAVARERFVAPGFANKLIGLPTYYLGQILIASSLAGP